MDESTKLMVLEHRRRLSQKEHFIGLTFSLATPFYVWRYSGGIARGNFYAGFEFSDDFYGGGGRRGVFSMGEILHVGIITIRNSNWESFPRIKLSIGRGRFL